jgi:hypothetical protein
MPEPLSMQQMIDELENSFAVPDHHAVAASAVLARLRELSADLKKRAAMIRVEPVDDVGQGEYHEGLANAYGQSAIELDAILGEKK